MPLPTQEQRNEENKVPHPSPYLARLSNRLEWEWIEFKIEFSIEFYIKVYIPQNSPEFPRIPQNAPVLGHNPQGNPQIHASYCCPTGG